ncbi:MAG: hypothetical protein CVU09_15595 [Bacteroidetes bacterium HGW-Bacteroidetes-4]|jgi:signal transduction histidine kinase/ligand-binding sensor domain-containing protein/DNA-binding response OmpR family regulator|nr:MAG: hypothetical protein CVU09_15595 [Bacteroidetes bacterium HGW-Bacteroidetes-4]
MKALLPFLLFIGFLTKAADSGNNLVFEHLSTEHGLSHGSVSAMLKDKTGFMWFATWDGLNRFDGHSFKVYKHASSDGTPEASNRIETLKQDANGNIWIITYDSKAYCFNPLSETFLPVPGPYQKKQTALVLGIFPQTNGDVWVSTKNMGVYRIYNDFRTQKLTILNYSENTTIPIKGNNVKSIITDSNSNIWVNTNKGLTCLAPDEGNNFKPVKLNTSVDSLFQSHVITTMYAGTSALFLGTQSGQLIIYNQNSQLANIASLPNQALITDIAISSAGLIYLGTLGNGVFEFNAATNEMLHHFKQAIISSVLKMYADSNNRLWIESTIAGISKIDLNTKSFKHYTQKLDVAPDIKATAQCGIMEDENQTLWLTLKGGGFGNYCKETDQIEYFYNEPGNQNSKLSNYVKCFYKDSSGILWLSTYFKGIEKVTFIHNKFRFVQPAPQYNLSIANEVRALLADSKGYLWVATKKQEVFILDSTLNVVKKIEYLNGSKIGMVYAFLETKNGDILMGTKGNGLFRLTRGADFNFKASHFVHDSHQPASLSNNNIYTLLQDTKGRIWIGTYGGGLNLFTQNYFLNAGNGLSSYPLDKANKVRHLAEDSNGNLWLASTNGLMLIDANQNNPADFNYTLFNKENRNVSGLKSNDIFWILCDKNNNLWVASLGSGLSQLTEFTPEKLTFYTQTKDDGLPSDVIFTINDDEDGNLWMTTENGISFYNTSDRTFKNYSLFEGIINSFFSEAAVARHSNGSFSLGANNGVYHFNPETFTPEENSVPLVFTDFNLLGKKIVPGPESVLKQAISYTKQIELKHNQNAFGLTWAALNYKTNDNIQYAYKLEAYDEQWNFAGTQNQISYNKIPPGSYTFMVQFVNPELQKLNQPQSIQIEIQPPIWRTYWAYGIYLFLVLIIAEISRRVLLTIIRLRNKVVIEKKLSEIKLSFFTNISHELRTPLTLILGPVRELASKATNQHTKYYTRLIDENAMRLLRLVNQLLDFRKIQNQKMQLEFQETELGNFINKVCANFNELAQKRQINFKITHSADPIWVLINEEKMDSVFYNLLSNAFKFTPDYGRIEVLITSSLTDSKVLIEIIDTGIGISKEQEQSLFTVYASYSNSKSKINPGTGIGLVLAKELVNLHKGTLTYRPNPGGGSIFSVKIDVIAPLSLKEISLEQNLQQASNQVANLPDHSLNKKRNKPRLLIIEDNQELLNFLATQMADKYQIHKALNGQEGLKMALKLQPDIIISDVIMPVMDGLQLLDKIKNNFETSHIPVVLLTAKSSVESKIEGLRYGADAYLTKPFHNQQLHAQLQNLLQQRTRLLNKYFELPENGNQNDSGISITEQDEQFLNQVRKLIEENLSNADFRLEDIYKEVGMGRSKFFDKLKGLTGLSPIDFVKEYRLNKAFSLLQKGIHNVSETAFLSGYTDAGYFSKCFKERFGLNPSEIIKN